MAEFSARVNRQAAYSGASAILAAHRVSGGGARLSCPHRASGPIDKCAPVLHDSASDREAITGTMSFFEELKRRNVAKVAVLYVVASWLR